MKFNEFDLRPEILRALDDAGYGSPTPIQEQAIPKLLEGRDLIGIAETGTGKTLAYLIPIFEKFSPMATDPVAVVICPTRELAQQVAGEAERFGRYLGVRVALAYGGTSTRAQQQILAEGCDILVATPGRLLDFVTSAWLSLRRTRHVVLDEADRMLDMGFINDVDAILKRTPMSRQTMLFSATIPDEIRNLADRYMLEPETVRMHVGTKVKATVEHAFYPVASSQKTDLLVELVRREGPSKVLVFCATREGTSELASHLRRRRFSVIALSSLLSQSNREAALEAFRSGERSVLVATDVAARGLDITDIELVVNYDPPMTAEEYVHRIGRTGRAARSGRAATLISELDSRRVADIERLLKQKVPEIRLDGFDYKPLESRRPRPSGRGRRPGRGARPGGTERKGRGSRQGRTGRRGRGKS
jgi:ATP-dependent RNA helicase RhlE